MNGACLDQDAERAEPVAGVKSVGIIGAGQMGSGIAHVIALAGYERVLNDLAKDRVDAALGNDRAQFGPPGGARRDQAGRGEGRARPHWLRIGIPGPRQVRSRD